MDINKLIGSILIVVGTTMGAGMLALPMVSAEIGFPIASITLIAIWAIMTTTSLFTLEVNLAFSEYANSLGTMATRTLGTWGKITSWLCTLLLLYSLTTAYIAGSASLLTNVAELILHIKTPTWFNALAFVVVMGGMIFWSTKSTDYCNRFFLALKVIFLIASLVLLSPQVDFVHLARVSHGNVSKCLWSMIPIFLCSFGFHTTIPSLTNYIGRKPRELKLVIVCGSSLTLVMYLLWLFVTMGVVPWTGDYSFTSIGQSNDVGSFIKIIYMIAHSSWITMGINGFSNFAMTTSFLGVTLGLFDFLADGFKRSNSRFGRLQTSLLTFTPPLILALFFPSSFVLALNYAAFFATILIVILPTLMVYNLRKNNSLPSPYRTFGGKYVLFFIMVVSVFMLGIQVFSRLHIL